MSGFTMTEALRISFALIARAEGLPPDVARRLGEFVARKWDDTEPPVLGGLPFSGTVAVRPRKQEPHE